MAASGRAASRRQQHLDSRRQLDTFLDALDTVERTSRSVLHRLPPERLAEIQAILADGVAGAGGYVLPPVHDARPRLTHQSERRAARALQSGRQVQSSAAPRDPSLDGMGGGGISEESKGGLSALEMGSLCGYVELASSAPLDACAVCLNEMRPGETAISV